MRYAEMSLSEGNMMAPLQASLGKKIGLMAGVATAVGIVVSSSAMVSLGEGIGVAGKGFIFAMVAALLLNVFVAFTFAELSGLIPRAGGLNRYTAPALGSVVSIVAVISGYALVILFGGSAEAAIAGIVVVDVFNLPVSPVIVSLVVVALLVFVNLQSVKVYGWVQIFLVCLMIASIVILGIIGLTGVGAGEPVELEQEFNPMGVGVLSLTALAFWLFIGVEFVTPLAEEIKKPRVYIPLAMVLGLLVIFIADIIFGFGTLNYLLPEQLAGSGDPHILAAEALAGPVGRLWMGIVTILATASTLNTMVTAVSRMLAAMAEEGEMPKIFAKRNKKGSPWVAVISMGILFVLLLVIGFADGESIIIFILASAFCWMLAYIVAHLNVIALRVRYPHAKSSFKSPLGITFQVLGIAGLVWVMANISADPEEAALIYKTVGIMLALALVYAVLWTKYAMKKRVFETTPLEEILKSDNQKSAESKDEFTPEHESQQKSGILE